MVHIKSKSYYLAHGECLMNIVFQLLEVFKDSMCKALVNSCVVYHTISLSHFLNIFINMNLMDEKMAWNAHVADTMVKVTSNFSYDHKIP